MPLKQGEAEGSRCSRRQREEKIKVKKLLLIVLVLIALLLSFSPSYSKYNGQNIKSAAGQLDEINGDQRIIVIKWYNQTLFKKEQITIYVPPEAIILKGKDKISFIELYPYSNVIVDYYDDTPGPLTAVRVYTYI